MDAISINVSGRRFETSQQTFNLMLQSMGAKIQSTPSSFINGRKEYFFERHADIFQAILCYYQTGELHMPQCVCPSLYQKELEFWAVSQTDLSKCCYHSYWRALDNDKKIIDFENYFTVKRRPLKTDSSQWECVREYCWQLINDPFTSLASRIYFWVTMSLVVINVLVVCLASHPQFHGNIPVREFPQWVQNYITRHYGPTLYQAATSNSTNITYDEFMNSDTIEVPFMFPYLFDLQIAFYIWFTFEFCFQILCCPSVKSFLFSPLHILDLLALVPFYTWLLIDATVPNGPYIHQAEIILLGISTVKVFRLLRLARPIRGLRVLLFTIKSSLEDVFLLILMLLMAAVLFSSVMYYVEDGDTFPSIIHGLWWAIVTMTTVGYGDQVPKTLAGKVVGCLCALSGVLIMALTVPVFASKFQLFYTSFKTPHSGKKTTATNPDKIKVSPVY